MEIMSGYSKGYGAVATFDFCQFHIIKVKTL